MASVSPPVGARRTWRTVLRKYFNIFRASLVERMAYRGDFLLGTVLRFLPVMTTILLWEAVFAGAGRADFGLEVRIDGSPGAAVIEAVREGGPGDRAGLRTGDRLVSVNGEAVDGLGGQKVGELARIEVDRGGRRMTVEVTPVERKLGGYTLREMIAYLLLIHISRMFSSMPGLAGGISRDIREGTLKKYLVQPLDMIGYLLCYRAAHKTAYITTSFLPYAGLFIVCAGYFDSFPKDGWMIAGYLAALLLGFLIGFFFEACIGMAGFWFLEVTSLLWVITTLTYFISGQMVPIDFLPQPWATILAKLPFQYLAYFPAVVFLGRLNPADLLKELLIAAFWVVVLVALTRWLYFRGLRRYSAYGG